jgi:hypothetical protein
MKNNKTINMKNKIIIGFVILTSLGCQKSEQLNNSENNEVFSVQGKWEINDSQCNRTEKDTVIIDSSFITYLSNCYKKEKYSFKLLPNSKIEFETTEFDWYYSKNSSTKVISPYRVISKDEFIVEKMLGADHSVFQGNPEDNRSPISFKRLIQ